MIIKDFYYQLIKYVKNFKEMAKRCSQPSSASSSSATATGVPSMMTMSPRQHLTSRRLNSQTEKLEETVSRTARVPPPKLLPSAVRHADSFITTAQLPTQVGIAINYNFLL